MRLRTRTLPAKTELAHVELSANYTTTAIGAANIADVTGFGVISFTMPDVPVLVTLNVGSFTVTEANRTVIYTVREVGAGATTIRFQWPIHGAPTTALSKNALCIGRLSNTTYAPGTAVNLKFSTHLASGTAGTTSTMLPTTITPTFIRVDRV